MRMLQDIKKINVCLSFEWKVKMHFFCLFQINNLDTGITPKHFVYMIKKIMFKCVHVIGNFHLDI